MDTPWTRLILAKCIQLVLGISSIQPTLHELHLTLDKTQVTSSFRSMLAGDYVGKPRDYCIG